MSFFVAPAAAAALEAVNMDVTENPLSSRKTKRPEDDVGLQVHAGAANKKRAALGTLTNQIHAIPSACQHPVRPSPLAHSYLLFLFFCNQITGVGPLALAFSVRLRDGRLLPPYLCPSLCPS